MLARPEVIIFGIPSKAALEIQGASQFHHQFCLARAEQVEDVIADFICTGYGFCDCGWIFLFLLYQRFFFDPRDRRKRRQLVQITRISCLKKLLIRELHRKDFNIMTSCFAFCNICKSHKENFWRHSPCSIHLFDYCSHQARL